MSADDLLPGSRLPRRSLLRLLGLAGAGSLMATRLSVPVLAGEVTPPAAPAAPGPSTRIEGFDGAELSAVSGPVRLPALAPKARLAACLMVPGRPGDLGDLALVRDVEFLGLTGPGGVKLSDVPALQRDPAAEHAGYRLFAALDSPEMKDVFGFAASVGEAGAASLDVEVRWRAVLRGGTSRGGAQQLLSGFHGIVLGSLAADGTFDDFVTYARVRRIS